LNDELSLLFDTASSLFADGKLVNAITCYEQILAKDIYNVRALHALGVINFQRQDVVSSIGYFQKIFAIQPDCFMAWCSLGKIQRTLGLHLSAKMSYQKAVELEPTSVEVLCLLGATCLELNLTDEAEHYLLRAKEIGAQHSQVCYELACLYQKKKQYSVALEYFYKSLELNPELAEAYAKLSQIYFVQGKIHESNNCLRNALVIKPESVVANGLLAFSLNYELGINSYDIFKISCDWARSVKKLLHAELPRFCNSVQPDRTIKIGFVSPDFRRHPVGYFVQSFMMLRDTDKFKVYCYSDVRGEDDVTKSLIEAADNWRRVYGIKDDKLAELIQRDEIDILVDLAGHTKDNRLNVFVTKPAPIQVTWAGYVGTTGLDSIDYLISDRYQSPEGAEEYTVEQIVRLSDDYICYMPPEYAPEVSPLPALENGFVTFGSFNNLAKISEEAISLWCEVLKQVSYSRIFIKNPSFSDRAVVDHYLALFKKHGISSDRITTEGEGTPEEMMACYACVDIQLDSLPYSGGLTTLESLWMGVPVVTLPGLLFSSRHSLSHLMNVGLSECVASSCEEYVAIARNLASDVSRLSQLRQSLRTMMAESPVCDGFAFTEQLQNVFRLMWKTWCDKTRDTFDGVDVSVGKEPDEFVLGDHIEYNEYGNHYSNLGDYTAALKCYTKAVDIKPGYIEAYFNMGLVYKRMGRQDDAINMLRLAICLAPDFLESYEVLEKILLDSGRELEAKSVARQAGDFNASINTGILYKNDTLI